VGEQQGCAHENPQVVAGESPLLDWLVDHVGPAVDGIPPEPTSNELPGSERSDTKEPAPMT